MALNDAVPSSATDVFKRNIEDTDRLLNTTDDVVNRVGTTLESFPNATGRVSDAADAAQIAIKADVDEAEAAKVAALASYAQWNSRGDWVTATAYAKGDIWNDTTTSTWYLALNDYTSGATVNDDITGPNVTVLQGAGIQSFEGLSEAIAKITANPELFSDNSSVSISSNKTKAECVSAGVDFPDGNGGDYVITTGEALVDGRVIAAGTKQLKLITQKINLPIENVTALRLFEPTVDGQECELSGHTIKGIGGGQFYAILNDVGGVDNNGTKFMTAAGHSWNRKSKSYSTQADFGCLGDGSNETVNLQAWIDSNTALLAGTNPDESVTEYKYTHLEMDKENHHLTVIGDVRFISISSGANASFLLSGDFATIERGFFLGASAGSKLETTGFSNYLDKVQVSGTHSEALSINGLETKVELGKYRGGANAAILVKQPDAFLLGPYVEQARDGLKATGVGSINGYHVHAFGNTNHGFSLSGSSFSQLTSCYADTNGKNGYDFRDMIGGLTLTDCWSFKSGELVANSAQMQFFNCQNTKLVGCRMNTPGAAGTSESIRFSGSTNQIDLVACYADQGTSSFEAPNTMTECTGELQKYSRSRATYLEGGSTVPASGSHGAVVKINTDTGFVSPGFKSFDVRVTYRASSGGAAIGVEDHTVFIISGISGPGNVVTRFPASPLLTLSSPLLTDIGNNIAEFSITLSNADATRNFQYSIEVTERSTTRGYI